MAATMAFRVAQLQGLAHTDAQFKSPPSLLYESPSNHKVSTDSAKEIDRPTENSSSGLNHAEDSSSVDSSDSGTAKRDLSSHSFSPTSHTAVLERSSQPRKTSTEGEQEIPSSFSSNAAAGRRAAGIVSAYSPASKNQRLETACPASDTCCGEPTNRQLFFNVFEDENNTEASCLAADSSSLQNHRHRSLTQDVNGVKAVAVEDDRATGSLDRYIPRRSAVRRGSCDSFTVHSRYNPVAHRISHVYKESSSENSGDAVPVKFARRLRRTSGCSAGSEASTYGTRKGHVNSNGEGYEQNRQGVSPRYRRPPIYKDKGRPVHHKEAPLRQSLGSHQATSTPGAGTVTSGLAGASIPLATGCVSAAAAPDDTRGAACAAAGSSLGPVSSHYCTDSLSEDIDDCESEELLGWKGWRELLLERQRAMENYMRAPRRHLTQREKVPRRAPNKQGGGRQLGRRGAGTHTHASNVHSSTEFDTEDETTSKEEDPLGLSPQFTATKRTRSLEKTPPNATATPRPPASAPQHNAATLPPPAAPASSFPTARRSAPPLPAGPPFFGPSFPTPFYPSWPPPFYAAAVAAAAAARRAGEEAGMTGQERIQDLKKALEQAKKETQDNQKEACSRLEEEKKKHEEEREELKKQLAQLRETLEEREKEVTVAAAKHAEAEKEKKVLREEFDIITRVHKDLKEEFHREKDSLLAEKATLQAKVNDLEKSIEFSKDQLLVARESLVAARAKQLTATQAHEQDLKTLKEYRLEIETLREDLKYLQILNLSLTEQIQRFSASPQRRQQGYAQTAAVAGRRRSGLEVTHGRTPQQGEFYQCAQHGSGNKCSNAITQRLPPQAMPTLEELLSPQLQQKLLRDRQNECRDAAARAPPLKEATFTLPSSLESHGEPPAVSSSGEAVCSGSAAVDLRGDSKKRDGLKTFAQAAVCTAGAASAEKAARTLNSARARLRTASPAPQTQGREADAPAGSPLPHVIAPATRYRSLPLPASAASAAFPAPVLEDYAQMCHFANSVKSEEVRLARLCATVLATHSKREQKRAPYVTEETHGLSAGEASSGLCKESLSLFPSSQCHRATLLQPDSGNAAPAPEGQHGPQQHACHLQQHQHFKDRGSHFPPSAHRATAEVSFEANTLSPRGKRGEHETWSHPFDREALAVEDQTPALNASIATEEKYGVLNSAQQERRPPFHASHVCLEERGASVSCMNAAEQSYLQTNDEPCTVSVPSNVSVLESCACKFSRVEDGKKLPRSDSRTAETNLPSDRARADNRSLTDCVCPKMPPGSSALSQRGKQPFSQRSGAATDAHLRSAFDDRHESAAGPAGLPSAAATAGVGARCPAHYTEQETSFASYHMQSPASNRTNRASSVGPTCETGSSKDPDSSSRCIRRDYEEKGATSRGSAECRKEENVENSVPNAEQSCLGNLGIFEKAEVHSSHTGENTCTSSRTVSVNLEKSLRNERRISVPGLALKGMSSSVARLSQIGKGAGSGSSSLCSGPNSARTQWLLNRVARISRLQGLHNIHEKLKDLPPALLAASDSARRSCQDSEPHNAADNGNHSDGGKASATGA